MKPPKSVWVPAEVWVCGQHVMYQPVDGWARYVLPPKKRAKKARKR